MKRILIPAALIAATMAGHQVGKQFESNKGMVQRIMAQPEKRYVIWNKNEFIKKPGTVSAMASVPGAIEMEHINGVVIAAKEPPKIQGTEDWVVQEEIVYSHMGCAREPSETAPGNPGCACPSPTPPVATATPGGPCTNCPPDGTPPPVASPIDSREFAWWAKQVHAPEAWGQVDTGQIKICVIDTGADQNHPDLQGVIIGGGDFTGSTGSWHDDQGHGTHVAGIIAAKLNGQGIAGVSRAKIIANKVLDSNGSGMSSWIADGIMDCVNKGAHIISASLGSRSPDQLIRQATDAAIARGVLFIAAAGNDGGAVNYPAANPGVIAVSAVDQNNRIASFSSRGSQIQYAGYGVDILSLRLGGGEVKMSGTSMATPGVAAVLAYAVAKGKKQAGTRQLGLGPTLEGKGLADVVESVK